MNWLGNSSKKTKKREPDVFVIDSASVSSVAYSSSKSLGELGRISFL